MTELKAREFTAVNSWQLADELQEVVDLLRKCPSFVRGHSLGQIWLTFYDKEQFLTAARAIGSVIKTEDKILNHYELKSTRVPLRISCPRDLVCRLVKPAVPAEYSCEPLLSESEEKELSL